MIEIMHSLLIKQRKARAGLQSGRLSSQAAKRRTQATPFPKMATPNPKPRDIKKKALKKKIIRGMRKFPSLNAAPPVRGSRVSAAAEAAALYYPHPGMTRILAAVRMFAWRGRCFEKR